MAKGSKAGGGPGSKQVHRTSEPKREPRNHAVNVKTVGQQIAGKPYNAFAEKPIPNMGPKGPTGNMSLGPGGGRTVYRSGGQHGLKPPVPMEPSKDMLSEYGPSKDEIV